MGFECIGYQQQQQQLSNTLRTVCAWNINDLCVSVWYVWERSLYYCKRYIFVIIYGFCFVFFASFEAELKRNPNVKVSSRARNKKMNPKRIRLYVYKNTWSYNYGEYRNEKLQSNRKRTINVSFSLYRCISLHWMSRYGNCWGKKKTKLLGKTNLKRRHTSKEDVFRTWTKPLLTRQLPIAHFR